MVLYAALTCAAWVTSGVLPLPLQGPFGARARINHSFRSKPAPLISQPFLALKPGAKVESSIPQNSPLHASAVPAQERCHHLIEKASGQNAVVVSVRAWPFAQIEAGPGELVALADDDPGALVIEAEVAFYPRRNFDGGFGFSRRTARDRQNRHDRKLAALTFHDQNRDARTVFDPLLSAGQVLVAPEIGVRNYEARFGGRNGHMNYSSSIRALR